MPAIASQATTFGSRSRVTVVLSCGRSSCGWSRSGRQVRQGYRRSPLTRPGISRAGETRLLAGPAVVLDPALQSPLVDPVAFFVTFGLILPAELPDKTFVATLVLSTRFRPRTVWLGVGAAFGVQTADRRGGRTGVGAAASYSGVVGDRRALRGRVIPDVPRGVRIRSGTRRLPSTNVSSARLVGNLDEPSGSVSECSLPPSGVTCRS